MKTLITGSNGQLGWELQRTVPEGTEIIAVDLNELDITDKNAVSDFVTECKPDIIINAAAYTAVDKAEEEHNLAYAVNRDGAENLAHAAKQSDSRLIHISTDFVFNGEHSRPYLPDDKPDPQSVYGDSKWQGEQQINTILEGEATIIRTAWVYSSHGHNFVKTMLRLMQERDSLSVVADQIGTPTWANGLARAVWSFALQPDTKGTFHWTDAGIASWYDFAVAAQEEALSLNILKKPIQIKPIRTQDYPTPAKRPSYSVLDKTSTWGQLNNNPVHWRQSLREMLKEL